MTVYDKMDWHVDGALRAGQPEENAFSHIGLYLGWLVRNDWTDADFIRSDWVAAIKRGEMTGSDLAAAVDGVLASDMLTGEGRGFTGYYYPTYLSDFSETFSDSGEYGVADNNESYVRIAPVLDRRYRAWVKEGRPSGPTVDEPRFVAGSSNSLAGMTEGDLVTLREQMEPMKQLGLRPPSSDPELEQIALTAWPGPPNFIESRTVAQWGEPLLKRALKRLGVDASHSTVATAMWSGPTVILYRVPGADAARLDDEFATAIHVPPKGRWERAEIGGRSVNLAKGNEFTVAYWVPRDDLVVHVAVTDPSVLEDVVGRLP
jgi:hypothetical protein